MVSNRRDHPVSSGGVLAVSHLTASVRLNVRLQLVDESPTVRSRPNEGAGEGTRTPTPLWGRGF